MELSLLVLFLSWSWVFLWERAKGEAVVARCDDGTCECERTVDMFKAVEFRAICVGNDTEQHVTVDESLFSKEPVPGKTRRVYVRIQNFTSAGVEPSFLARWRAYTSCSFDIWHCGKVVWPEHTPPLAPTKVSRFTFSGIGVIGSSIDKFTEGLFKGKQVVGLILKRTDVDYLNVYNLSPKAMNYLTVKDSVIKVFEGSPSKPLSMKHSSGIGPPRIKIEDSEIGFLSESALAFKDYKYFVKTAKGSISIKGSTIGVLEKSSIKLGEKIDFEIEGSNLGYVSPSAFIFDTGNTASFSMTGNILGLKNDSLKNLKCGPLLKIQENSIHPKAFSDCVDSAQGQNALVSPSTCNNVFHYIDSSCENNRMLFTRRKPSSEILSTPSNFEQPTNDQQTYDRPLNSTRKLSGAKTVHIGFFYLVMIFCLILLLVVAVLIGIVVWGKRKPAVEESNQRRERTDSIIYEKPCASFFITNMDEER